MKPKNFPGRKNDRRKRAVARMIKPKGLTLAEECEHPYHVTKSRILPDDTARSIRTKKDRSARGKLR